MHTWVGNCMPSPGLREGMHNLARITFFLNFFFFFFTSESSNDYNFFLHLNIQIGITFYLTIRSLHSSYY